MNPWIGWGLALIALVAGWRGYGGRGLALAATVIVFWLLIQFNRSVRVMRDAADSPVGHVPSAVMLHAGLRPGMPMLEVVKLTKSLGQRLGALSGEVREKVAEKVPEVWTWTDDSGAAVQIVFDKGRCASWTLSRPDEAAP